MLLYIISSITRRLYNRITKFSIYNNHICNLDPVLCDNGGPSSSLTEVGNLNPSRSTINRIPRSSSTERDEYIDVTMSNYINVSEDSLEADWKMLEELYLPG